MDNPPVTYSRHRFPTVVISYAVWLYYRFSLSYRDVEELLAQRGIAVSYETPAAGAANSVNPMPIS